MRTSKGYRKSFGIAAVAMVAIPILATADVVLENNGSIWVTNTIQKKDFDDLKQIVATRKGDETLHVILNTHGGSITAALAMGRLLRSNTASVNVGQDAICASSCVLLLAGAPIRGVQSHLGAKVAIHRPYDPNDQETTLEGQKRNQQQIERAVRDFLKEVNVPDSLYDDMLRVSPSQLKVLSPSELTKYGLNADDPYLVDANETKEAKKIGISKAVYLERKSRAKVICPNYVRPGKIFDDIFCESNVIRGLPPGNGLP